MRPLFAAIVIGVLSIALPAGAQDARELFRQGQAAYEGGDYDTAVLRWQEAYRVDARPLIQFNLAQAYERLGRLDEARIALESYIATAEASDPNQTVARSRLHALQQRIERTSVVIEGAPEGARIRVDGEDRGRAPRPDPIPISAGEHQIVLELEGYQPFTSTVLVPAGERLTIQVSMQREGGGGGGGGVPVVPIVVMAGGGALLVTGAILGGVALSSAQSAPAPDGPEADSARGLAIGADVCLAVGGAAAITGLVLLLVGVGSESPPAQAQVTPLLGPDVAGVSVAGAF